MQATPGSIHFVNASIWEKHAECVGTGGAGKSVAPVEPVELSRVSQSSTSRDPSSIALAQ